MTRAAGLRREEPHWTTRNETRETIDETIGQVAVAIAPPHDDAIHDFAGVLIFEIGVDEILDGVAKVEVYIVVVPELLHKLAFVELKNFGKVVARSCNR
ncbi:Uncharacterised protein [Mycobacteroides abscessus subsp. abscessus]|nr:Uncharacterised protein [Mycobacteroides abscessus subsp. abscessus]